jgi:hypothetical protein
VLHRVSKLAALAQAPITLGPPSARSEHPSNHHVVWLLAFEPIMLDLTSTQYFSRRFCQVLTKIVQGRGIYRKLLLGLCRA